MKVTIELDSASPGDLLALQRMFAAAPAVVHAVLPPVFEPAVVVPPAEAAVPRQAAKKLQPAAKPSPVAKAIEERGKAMTKAAQALGSVVGERTKLTRLQKAKVAAKARWTPEARAKASERAKAKAAEAKAAQAKAGVKQAKQAKPATPPKDPTIRSAPVKKPAPRPEPKPQDYSRAEEQAVSSYAEVPGGEVRLPGAEDVVPAYPDGRELLEGTFRLPEPPKEGDDHERDIEQIARELGGLPVDDEPAGNVSGL